MLFNIALALGGIAAVRDRREAAACDALEPCNFYFASWKITPAVCLWPERTRLTPWRIVTR